MLLPALLPALFRLLRLRVTAWIPTQPAADTRESRRRRRHSRVDGLVTQVTDLTTTVESQAETIEAQGETIAEQAAQLLVHQYTLAQHASLLTVHSAYDVQNTIDLADTNTYIALVNQTQTVALANTRAEFVARFIDDETSIDALQLLTNGTSTTLGLDLTDGHILVGGLVDKLQVLTAGTSDVLGLSRVNGTILVDGLIYNLLRLTSGIASSLSLNTTTGAIITGGTTSLLQTWVAGASSALGLNITSGVITTTGAIATLQTNTTDLLSRRSMSAWGMYRGTPSGGYSAGSWVIASSLASFVTTSAGYVHCLACCSCGTQSTGFSQSIALKSSAGTSATNGDWCYTQMTHHVSLAAGKGETISCAASLTNYESTNDDGYWTAGCIISYTFIPN